jgi:hypothetical protein
VRLIGVAEGDEVVSIVRLEDQGVAVVDGNGVEAAEDTGVIDPAAGPEVDATPDDTPEPFNGDGSGENE